MFTVVTIFASVYSLMMNAAMVATTETIYSEKTGVFTQLIIS